MNKAYVDFGKLMIFLYVVKILMTFL